METGLAMFRERGFEETRVQDIVEQVGVSPATFFNYFATKDAILDAQAEQATDLYAASYGTSSPVGKRPLPNVSTRSPE